MAYDRYSYVYGNSLKYTDPTGYEVCDEDGNCFDQGKYRKINGQTTLAWWMMAFGIDFEGEHWSIQNKRSVINAARIVGARFANVIGNGISGWRAFRTVYELSAGKTFTFKWDANCYHCRPQSCQQANDWTGDCAPAFGVTEGRNLITFASMSPVPLRQINNVIHELGHAFNVVLGRLPETAVDRMPFLLQRPEGFYGTAGNYTWVQSPQITASEIFADQFLGWLHGLWGSDAWGPIRAEFMMQMNGPNGWVAQAAGLP